MDANLKVDDEYVQRIGRIRNIQGLKLDVDYGNGKDCIFNAYINILESIKSEAIIQGDIANALEAYISCAKSIKGQLKSISDDLKNLCNCFIEEIDVADKDIFV